MSESPTVTLCLSGVITLRGGAWVAWTFISASLSAVAAAVSCQLSVEFYKDIAVIILGCATLGHLVYLPAPRLYGIYIFLFLLSVRPNEQDKDARRRARAR